MKIRSLILIISIVITVAVLAFANPFSLNDAGYRQVVQTVGGDLSVRFEPGVYFSGFFSTITTYPNNVTVQVGPEEKRSKDADYWSPPNTGTFAEGDQASMGHTVKWDLPNKPDLMIKLHKTYQNIDNLANTTLMQFQRETASYSCQRLTSEAHYSGGQSQLKDYFQDQLRNGQVLLETETKTNTLSDGTTKTFIIVEEILGDDGLPKRTEGDVQDFQLVPSFVSIDYIKYDSRIYKKLEEKIDAAADEATSKQRLITAQQEEQTAIVQGRKMIAKVTAEQEAIEAEEVIKARKERKVAEENVLRDKAKAASTLALKKAEAEGDKLKVLAGLSPLEKAQIDKATRIGVAEKLSNVKFPTTMIIVGSGGEGTNGVNPFDAVGLESFYNLSKNMSTDNKKK